MSRKVPVFFLTVCFLSCVVLPGLVHAGPNLIEDGSFEDEANVTAWYRNAFRNTEEAVRFEVTTEASATGSHSLAISNLVPNDATVMQTVKVKPETWYRLSCRILARQIETERLGACLGVMGCLSTSADYKDTAGRWGNVELTGKTGRRQYSLTVVLRIGFFSSLARGTAFFDDVQLEELSAPPLITDLFDFSCLKQNEELLNPAGNKRLREQYAVLRVLLILLGSIVAGTALLVSILILTRRRKLRMFEKNPASISPEHNLIELRLTVRLRQVLAGGLIKEYILKSLYLTPQKIFVLADELACFKKGEVLGLEIDHRGERFDLGQGIVRRLQAGLPGGLGGVEIVLKNKGFGRFRQLKAILYR